MQCADETRSFPQFHAQIEPGAERGGYLGPAAETHKALGFGVRAPPACDAGPRCAAQLSAAEARLSQLPVQRQPDPDPMVGLVGILVIPVREQAGLVSDQQARLLAHLELEGGWKWSRSIVEFCHV